MSKTGGGRGRANANPAPKRRKINDENIYSEEREISMEQLTPNMGGKRKPEDENDEESPENTNQLAKRRRKGFQMDIRMFSIPTNIFDNRVNQTFNNKINEIYCRHLPSQTRTAVERENDESGYRVTMMGNAV